MRFWRPPSRWWFLLTILIFLSLTRIGEAGDLDFLARRGGGGMTLSWPALIFKALGSFLRKTFSSFTEQKSFIESFEQTYGRKHVDFVDAQTLPQAATLARQAQKFLIVYLPSGLHRDEKKHQGFLKALTDPEVVKSVKGSFVVWVATSSSAAAKTATRELKAKKIPFLAVVHVAEKTRKMTVKNIHHFKPPPSPEQTVSWLARTLEVHGAVLVEDKKEREYTRKEANLQVEQKVEFAKALQADRDRLEKEKREAAEKKAKEEAAKKKAKEDAVRRERKRGQLGSEPTGRDVCKIMIKMQDGRKIQRYFLPGDRLEKLFDWADVEGLDLEATNIVLSRPRRTFAYPNDKDVKVEEAGLMGQVLLFIEPRSSSSSSQ